MLVAHIHIQPMCRAGLPTTSAKSGTDLITTAPAPMNEYRPIVIPQTIVALAPIVAFAPMSVVSSAAPLFFI